MKKILNTGRASTKRRRKASSVQIPLPLLILIPPFGIIYMWVSDRCRWRTYTKSLMTALALSLTIICSLTVYTAMNRETSAGTTPMMVRAEPKVEVYGPSAPEGVTYSYTDSDTIQQAVIVTPAPTEVPETVFYNVGGKYYHTENCKYVKTGTQIYYITRMIEIGIKPCPDCAAGELAAEYGGTGQ